MPFPYNQRAGARFDRATDLPDGQISLIDSSDQVAANAAWAARKRVRQKN
jgi:hypothetical protein